MIVDNDPKSKRAIWFMLGLFVLVFIDLIAWSFIPEVTIRTLFLNSIIQLFGFIGFFMAARFYESARVEHNQHEAAMLILDQLNPDEVNHVLGELRTKDLTFAQKQLVERLISEHCHVDAHI